MDALEIKNLNKTFDGFNIKNINLSLSKGYILGYIGQNGAGKTTTIKLIMNQIKKDSGEIRIFGKEYNDDEAGYKNMIGFIGDECYFPTCFTLKDVIATMKDFYISFNEDKFREYVERWQLPYKKKIKEFSKGMKVKLSFASVLSRDTKLLLLDEPTSGLDPVIRSEILEILQEYIADGERSVLFSTHITSDLEKITDYLFFINKGEKVFYDTTENILESHLLVKGGIEDLTEELREKLIGHKSSSYGFEGLISSKDKQYINENLLLEKPSMDEIIVFYISGMRRN
ncbi:ABC transporter ATP-binding protein [Clostridium chromiireducens]|uniref:ABC transporter ATP-binding protein YtrB n=1 Tax=Clostridium chromiireducens TaxID=225345 RepID=A0A1V4IMD0_9CLOT|nr:ABC transporter ATP-binding protein [Clostridium chromiireducens]MVX62427.1 ATP-binding cassette domain-containing protein [Clostridium chromiireducens]OPJ61004.1 ABC transporter ATP-binding protein YtrB [Clostridium chromiireducens]